ncbi:hypothetical protein LCGC14_0532310 [marine sediment metagenome]|uniref:Uncharacterized protein n=1 Tax=marine sediment metagenome TaxID=412755 RepID=A0A0F9SDN2_9ZZZZ
MYEIYLHKPGCYVDNTHGIYMVDRIVEIAESWGMSEPEVCGEDSGCARCEGGDHEAGDGSYTEWSFCMSSQEVIDEATEYMNANFGLDDCYWGFSSQGDWGLWPCDEG